MGFARALDAFQIPYEYLDIEKNEKARNWLCEHAKGEGAVPSLYLPSGELLIMPSHETLADTFGISFIAKHFRHSTKPLKAAAA